MKKLFIKIIVFALLVITTISSCSNEIGGTPIAAMEINVTFVSPTGTNIIDSLNLAKTQGGVHYGYSLDGISFNWRNKNNDLNQNWARPELQWVNLKDIFPNYSQNGTALHANFVDISHSENNKERDEEYTFEIKSEEIFGNDDAHTIKYYVHIKGLLQYNTYKCEVDGKEYPLMGPSVDVEKENGDIHINNLCVAFTVDRK